MASPGSLASFPHTDGLALEAIEASRHDLLTVLGHDRRRDGDDRDRPRCGIRTKFPERLDPVHGGQLNVHEDQGGMSLVGQLYPSSPVSASIV